MILRSPGRRPGPVARARLLNIDDSGARSRGFPSVVVLGTRVHLLVVLSPPLLAELAVRRLAALDASVVAVADDDRAPAGHYDAVVRNVPLPPDVTAQIVIDLPPPAGAPPVAAAAEEREVLDRLDDVAELLARRFFGASS
jgi:hypothetical protein